MQRLSRYVQAYVRVWVSCCVIQNYWNAAVVSIFTSISKDIGVVLCHPELLEISVCHDFYKHIERCGSHVMSSGIVGMQRLSRYLYAYVGIWESFDVIWNYWNAVLIFTSTCKDMGSFYVIRNYWIAAFVSIFVSICKDVGVI